MNQKIICLYLPQFHEFEENNNWWGKGFTEWTCVKKAKSLADGHIIKKPHKDIGFYNLLDIKIRKYQADLAKNYGIYGFCYYHYWFYDKVLMNAVLEKMLLDGQPDIPFMLSWANEPWRRRMNGGNDEILQGQKYGDEQEWELHLNYLLKFFTNKNYIKINNKPVFCIYRISSINNYTKRFSYWNKKIKDYGFDGIFIVMTIGLWPREEIYPILPHVNAVFDFYPNFLRQPDTIEWEENNIAFCEMDKAHKKILNDPIIHENHYCGTMVGFDNTPRSPKKGCVFINNSPRLFENAMLKQIQKSNSEFFFINAWNEWGEQACLEPDELYGNAYLQSLKKSLRKIKYA